MPIRAPHPPTAKTKSDGSTYYVYTTSDTQAIEYREIIDNSGTGYEEDVSIEEVSCTRVLECRWDFRYKFYDALIGWAEINGGTSAAPAGLKRHLPEPHPYMNNVFCTGAKLVMGTGRPDVERTDCIIAYVDTDLDPPGSAITINSAGGIGHYGRARFVTKWEKLNFNVWSDEQMSGTTAAAPQSEFFRFVDKTSDWSGQSIPIPGNQFKWVTITANDGGVNQYLPAALSKKFYREEITYTWMRVPDVPTVGIQACLGKVNNATFDGYAAGTLLFEAPMRKRMQNMPLDPDGYYYDHAFKMLYAPETWNKLYRATLLPNPGFDEFTVSGATNLIAMADGQSQYDYADFTKLFKVP